MNNEEIEVVIESPETTEVDLVEEVVVLVREYEAGENIRIDDNIIHCTYEYVLPGNVVKDGNYVHTDNNFTNEDKEKLANLENADLSDYYTKAETDDFVDTELDNYYTKAEARMMITQDLESYYTREEADEKFGNSSGIAYQPNEPTEESVVMWIDTDDNDNQVIDTSMYVEKPVVLYANETGSKDEITLSESASNFEYIEILYKKLDDYFTGSQKVYLPDGKNVSLMGAWPGTYQGKTLFQFNIKIVKISGTTITNVGSGDGNIYDGNGFNPWISKDENNIAIYRVLGYRK